MRKALSIFILTILFTGIVNHLNGKTYKIACLNDYHPYSSVNTKGELTGIIIDWWELWATETGNKVIFVPTNIEGCLTKINNNEADIIAGLFYSAERAKILSFADNLLRMKTVLFIKNSLIINSIGDIKTAIGVVNNDLAHYYLKDSFPAIELKVYDSYSALRYAAREKELDAFVYDLPNPLGDYKPIKIPDNYKAFKTLFTNNLRPAVKSDNAETMNVLMESLSKVPNNKIMATAYKWDMLVPNTNNKIKIIGSIAFLVLLALVVVLIVRIRKQNQTISKFESDADVIDIISKGENDSIEFKSSLRWDYKQEKPNKILEQVIIKTISAFLNSNGGTLLIGVDDDGNILGLDNDYNSFSKKNADGFMLALTNLINQNLGKRTHKFISVNIISVNEKDVCIISILKSDKPVFIGKNDKEEFYIRASASSQPMGLREAYEYIYSNWDN